MDTLQKNIGLVRLLVVVIVLGIGWYLGDWILRDGVAAKFFVSELIFLVAAFIGAQELRNGFNHWQGAGEPRSPRKTSNS